MNKKTPDIVETHQISLKTKTFWIISHLMNKCCQEGNQIKTQFIPVLSQGKIECKDQSRNL